MRPSALALGLLLVGLSGCPGPAPTVDAGPDAALGRCPAPGVHADTTLAGVTVELHVPSAHRCEVPSALVVELTGALDDGETSTVDALSESEPFVLARVPGASLDRALLEALVIALEDVVAIDPARIDVVGSGEGARVASALLHEGTLTPRGIGLVEYDAPADEAAAAIRDFGAQRPRVWLSTGARGLGIDAQRVLLAAFDTAGWTVDDVRVRERDTGPATPAWLFPELFDWLVRAEWPESGPPATPWVRQRFDWPDATLLALDAMPDATFVSGALDGRVFGTNASGKWSLLGAPDAGALIDVLASSGAPLGCGTRALVRSTDGVDFVADASSEGIVALVDRGDHVFGVTASQLRLTDDRGAHWASVASLERIEALAASPVTHTIVVVGQSGSYLRYEGAASSTLTIDARLHDVAAGADGSFWVVGAHGAVLRSIDDARTFSRVLDPEGAGGDLYAVSVGSDGAMIAGGASGAVVVSHDGATLARWPTGREGLVGEVRWLAPGSALILGEPGLVAIADGL